MRTDWGLPLSLLLIACLVCLNCGCRAKGYAHTIAGHDRARLASVPLRDGESRADDLARRLGPPDYRSDDGSFLAYYSDVDTRWYGTPGGNADDRTLERYALLLRFDETGTLLRHRLRRIAADAPPWDSVVAIARRWGVESPIRGLPTDPSPPAATQAAAEQPAATTSPTLEDPFAPLPVRTRPPRNGLPP